MVPLLTGTTDTSIPVCPLHVSFYDFLHEEKQSGQFFISEAEVHRELTLTSLIMWADLQFNICALPTLYLRNSDAMVDLEKGVEENIQLHLLYSCCSWTNHIQTAQFNSELVQHPNLFATREKILFWMGALGVLGHIHEAYRALISALLALIASIHKLTESTQGYSRSHHHQLATGGTTLMLQDQPMSANRAKTTLKVSR